VTDLRQLLGRGQVVLNGWLSADSAYLAEVLSHSGFGAAVALLQGVGLGPAVPLARPSRLDAAVIGKLLDAGARGIICPQVDSPEQAAEFVAMSRYPPDGVRSYGPARAALAADAGTFRPMTWDMIESAPALDQLEAIVAVPGLDAVFVGPNDLALALGAPAGTVQPPDVVLSAMERIVDAAHAAGLWAGSFCADGQVGRQLVELGFDMISPGSDVALLRAAAAREIARVRGGSTPT
jgi:4-hydroxy-2-oxoheptanedioate aldolase